MLKALEGEGRGVEMSGYRYNYLRYVDDIVMVAENNWRPTKDAIEGQRKV